MLHFITLLFPLLSLNAQDFTSVIDADTQLNQFIITHNVSAAAGIYLDDFVLTTSSGSSKSKQDMLGEIGLKDLIFEVNKTTDVTIRLYTNTAVLIGTLHQKGTYKNTPFDNKMLVTDTWLYIDGRWKLLAGHATVIKKP
jgi:hypothetical protein